MATYASFLYVILTIACMPFKLFLLWTLGVSGNHAMVIIPSDGHTDDPH